MYRDRLIKKTAAAEYLHEPGQHLGIFSVLTDHGCKAGHRFGPLSKVYLQRSVEVVRAGEVGLDRKRPPSAGVMMFYQVAGGRIEKFWMQVDMMSVFEQLKS